MEMIFEYISYSHSDWTGIYSFLLVSSKPFFSIIKPCSLRPSIACWTVLLGRWVNEINSLLYRVICFYYTMDELGSRSPVWCFKKIWDTISCFWNHTLRCNSTDDTKLRWISAKLTRWPNSAECCVSKGASKINLLGGYLDVIAPTNPHFSTGVH